MSELARELGRLVRVERKRLGMSQVELANKMNVSQNVISQWEKASTGGLLDLKIILPLESIFGLPRGALVQRLGLTVEPPDYDAVVLSDPNLTNTQKEALVSMYHAMRFPGR